MKSQQGKSVRPGGARADNAYRGGSDEKVTVGVASYTANPVEVTVVAGRLGWLVLSESYFPGWVAWVNEIPKPALRANWFLPKGWEERKG